MMTVGCLMYESMYFYYTMNFMQEQGLAKSTFLEFAIVINMGSILTTSGCILTEMTKTSQ